MSELIEIVINSMQKYAGHKTGAKIHAEHIVNTVLEQAVDNILREIAAENSSPQPDEGYIAGCEDSIIAIEKLKD